MDITDDDSEITFENDGNDIYTTDCYDEQASVEDNFMSIDDNICREWMFVDGNDDDFELCEYEDTLVERIWRLSKPPKVPRQACVVPARRIQVMKERLSPALKGLPTAKESSNEGANKKEHRRNKAKSDVHYVKIMNFDEEKQSSCQKKTVITIPNCARKLEDLL